MKKQKNRLDEMQEQKLLKIEHNGCWLAFWGLLAVMLVQLLIYGQEADENIIGEWIVFMCLAVYIVVDCFRNGIWDRKFSPTLKSSAYYSVIAGVAVGVIYFIISYREYHTLAGSIATGIFMMALAFAACFAGMSLLAAWYVKRENKIENEEKKETDGERNERE